MYVLAVTDVEFKKIQIVKGIDYAMTLQKKINKPRKYTFTTSVDLEEMFDNVKQDKKFNAEDR